MGWHQVAAGHAAGLAMRLLYGTRYTDMWCVPRHRPRHAAGARYAGNDLRLEPRNADGARRGTACGCLRLPVRNRRRIGGVSKVAGTVRGTLRAGSRIVATFVRVAVERSPRVAEVRS